LKHVHEYLARMRWLFSIRIGAGLWPEGCTLVVMGLRDIERRIPIDGKHLGSRCKFKRRSTDCGPPHRFICDAFRKPSPHSQARQFAAAYLATQEGKPTSDAANSPPPLTKGKAWAGARRAERARGLASGNRSWVPYAPMLGTAAGKLYKSPPSNNGPPGHQCGPHLRPSGGGSLFGPCFFVESRKGLKRGPANYLDGRLGPAGVAHYSGPSH